MAVGNPTTGAVNIQAPLDDVVLTLEETFGERSRSEEAVVLRTLVAKQKASRNFLETVKSDNGDRKIYVTWFDDCNVEAQECETDLCDVPTEGTMEELNKAELTIDKCWERIFHVDVDLLEKSKVNGMSYVQRELDRTITSMIREANEYVISVLDAGAGVTHDGQSSVEFDPTIYHERQAVALARLFNESKLSNMEGAFVLNDGTWMLPTLIAELSREDRRFPWVANQLMDVSFDAQLTSVLSAGEHGFLVSPNAYAIAGENFQTPQIQSWFGRGGAGIESFSMPTGIDGLVADVYVSRICKDAERNRHVYEYVVKLRADIFLNPSECYFGDKIEGDAITGIIKYGNGVEE